MKKTPCLFLFVLGYFSIFGENRHLSKSVLFLGNSYTAQSAHFIKEVFKRENVGYELVFLNPGGVDLSRHLASEKTRSLVASRRWKFVILQGQSQKSGLGGKFTEDFHSSLSGLCKLARKKGAEPCLFMTWGRRDGDKRNLQTYPDFQTMNQKISRQYKIAGDANDALVAPVGEAFANLHIHEKAIFKSLYRGDGSHPAPPAGYLCACIFYGKLTGESPLSISWNANLSPEIAATLREVAAKVLMTQRE